MRYYCIFVSARLDFDEMLCTQKLFYYLENLRLVRLYLTCRQQKRGGYLGSGASTVFSTSKPIWLNGEKIKVGPTSLLRPTPPLHYYDI